MAAVNRFHDDEVFDCIKVNRQHSSVPIAALQHDIRHSCQLRVCHA